MKKEKRNNGWGMMNDNKNVLYKFEIVTWQINIYS